MNFFQITLLGLIRFYRWVLSPAKSAFFGPLGRCRYTPSCSAYALEAVQTHGAADGGWLAAKRLLRCHPWGGCGPDPVPPRAAFPSHEQGFHPNRQSLVPMSTRGAANGPDFKISV